MSGKPHGLHDSWNNSAEAGADGNDTTVIFKNGEKCIGIDLGTTNSCVAIWKEDANHVKVLRHPVQETKTIPSVVFFPPNNHQDPCLVGQSAKDKLESHPENTITCIKRFMGKRYDEAKVEDDVNRSLYKLEENKKGLVNVQIKQAKKTRSLTPEEISALVLGELKRTAEDFTGETIHNAVITVPAYFNDAQRKATLMAADFAGFRSVRLLNEPSAAAMAYGLFVAGTKVVAVFDFGGGTFDVSLMLIDEGKFEVMGVGGDTHLGGEDINNVIEDYVMDAIKQKMSLKSTDFTNSEKAEIRCEVERAKISLSLDTKYELRFEHVQKLSAFQLLLTRDKFEELNKHIFDRCIALTKEVIEQADVHIEDIDEIILVGGSTRIPGLRSRLKELFQGKELCMSVNADQVVAEGAAIQGAILSGVDRGILRDVLMFDVIPMSIGLEKADGKMEVLLPKNSKIPVSVTKHFETFEDNQRGITVEVYEGENAVAKDNQHICYFNFLLPKDKIVATAGQFKHPVTFTMNANGVLQVRGGIHHESAEKELSKSAIWLMILYMVFLLGMYLFVRIYFSEHRMSMEANAENVVGQ